MTLFDRLTEQALASRPDLTSVQAVVEKELLHHDILREMNAAGLLNGLTFIGGTCLRACYGSDRLSEDLDFTGGRDFSREALKTLAGALERGLETRYGLTVKVSEPVKETSGVDTWKLSVLTRPGRQDLPVQQIHIDVCAIPSYERRPMMLRNLYGVDMGTSGLILQAQSREEILADKLIALALRPNRIKNRDLWDMAWLKRQGVNLPPALIPKKIGDRHRTPAEFSRLLQERAGSLTSGSGARLDFVKEMRRFLPVQTVRETVETPPFWDYLSALIQEESQRALTAVGC